MTAESVADAVLFALAQPAAASVDELHLMPARDPFAGGRSRRITRTESVPGPLGGRIP